MKKLIILLALTLGLAVSSNAQISNKILEPTTKYVYVNNHTLYSGTGVKNTFCALEFVNVVRLYNPEVDEVLYCTWTAKTNNISFANIRLGIVDIYAVAGEFEFEYDMTLKTGERFIISIKGTAVPPPSDGGPGSDHRRIVDPFGPDL